jgi:hypothetical protein
VIDLRHPAVSYAGLGWPIFRCKRGSKVPDTAHGFKDSSADVDRVDEEWRRHPHANIGMPTGRLWDVLDLDVKPASDKNPGGVNARLLVPRLEAGGWLAGAVGIAETRNGGLHLYFPASGLPSSSILHLGVDLKASGGFVLLAPSRVESDFPGLPGRYRWIRFPNGPGAPLDWHGLRAELDPTPEVDKPRYTGPPADPGRRLEGLCRTVADAPEGSRNRLLFWAACRLAEEHQLDQHGRAALAEAARRAGLTDWEAERTIASAARRAGGTR